MLKSQVLTLLRQKAGERITGGELSRTLHVSRTAIWKAINTLREEGCDIESLQSSGYRLLAEGDMLTVEAIRFHLRTNTLGSHIDVLESVSSTNSHLRSLSPDALQEGYVLVANEQTRGRGRMNRPFYSLAGQGCYFSVLLKPTLTAAEIPLITVSAAVAVARAVEEVCGFSPDVKWVNDVYVKGRKLCGILTEASLSAELGAVEYVVVGIGINTGEIPYEVADSATSLYRETGVQGIRARLIAKTLEELEHALQKLAYRGKRAELLEEYTRRQCVIGKRVRVSTAKESFPAVALGVDGRGRLLVRDDAGETRRIAAGEITLQSGGSEV